MFQDEDDDSIVGVNESGEGQQKSSKISALNVYLNTNQVEQLLVGTSNGVLIILDCKTVGFFY
jgi:hypothetical protein